MSAYEPTGTQEDEGRPGRTGRDRHDDRPARWRHRVRRMASEASWSFFRGIGTTASGVVMGVIVVWAQRR